MARPDEVTNEELLVHLCGPEDRDEQARLFNQVFKKRVDGKALAWRYDQNPHGQAVSLLSRPPGADGICGYACSPRRFVPKGDEKFAAPIGETGDVMTHPEWRKRGIFSSLDAACMLETKKRGWPAVFGLPNRHSANIFLRIGWEQVGTIRHYSHLLRSDEHARFERLREGRLAKLTAPWHARRARKIRSEMSDSAARFEVRQLDDFPDEVEAISKAREVEFAIMVRRDAEYLRWRFLRGPSGLHRVLGVFDSNCELRGFSVVQLPREGEHKGWLVDLLAYDVQSEDAAISAGLQLLEQSGASVVQANAIDDSYWAAKLAGTGFVAPKAENHLIVILFANDPKHPLVRAARDASKWYLTDGDRDDETVG